MRHCSMLSGLGGLGGLGCLLRTGTSGRASLAAEARTNKAITGLTIAVLIHITVCSHHHHIIIMMMIIITVSSSLIMELRQFF